VGSRLFAYLSPWIIVSSLLFGVVCRDVQYWVLSTAVFASGLVDYIRALCTIKAIDSSKFQGVLLYHTAEQPNCD